MMIDAMAVLRAFACLLDPRCAAGKNRPLRGMAMHYACPRRLGPASFNRLAQIPRRGAIWSGRHV